MRPGWVVQGVGGGGGRGGGGRGSYHCSLIKQNNYSVRYHFLSIWTRLQIIHSQMLSDIIHASGVGNSGCWWWRRGRGGGGGLSLFSNKTKQLQCTISLSLNLDKTANHSFIQMLSDIIQASGLGVMGWRVVGWWWWCVCVFVCMGGGRGWCWF